jgi:predicted flap endonuclease-1-like 5' DNA nuclease
MPIAKFLRTVFGIESADPEESTESTSVTVEREPAAEDDDAEDETEAEADTEPPEPDAEVETDEPDAEVEAEETDAEVEAEVDAEETDAEAEEDTPTADGSEASVESVSGIGPAYAERLEAAGVETVADLLAADPEAIAAESDLSEKRVSGWQETAETE